MQIAFGRCIVESLAWPVRKGEMVIPALLWVTFWSSLMAAATCFADVARPAAEPPKHRD
jgi:hypothetical protein